jgi:pyruvate formate lyase activating enzyme
LEETLNNISFHEARYWKQLNDNQVQCELCPHKCIIPEERMGICGQRVNQGGKLYTLNYKRCCSANIDPIEKKPLYHFFPGSQILSVGTNGCNFACSFCQNHEISQAIVSTVEVSSEMLIEKAKQENAIGIAFTYNEPVIWYEFVSDCAREFKKAGLKTVMVTNGYIEQEPLKEILPYIDAMNIDLKAFDNVFYQKLCKGTLAPVLDTIQTVAESGCHLEITNLLIPCNNDSKEHTKTLFSWVAAVNPDIPMHISRFFPRYKLKAPETSRSLLEKIWATAAKRLNYVYIGNLNDPKYNSTFCPKCSALLIERSGYEVNLKIDKSLCPSCNCDIPIVLLNT